MTTYNEFTNWLFPGDDVSRARNPERIPPEIAPLLEEVQCKTGVPLEWLQRTAGLVIDGLAGAQCLWFLHGTKGSIVDQETLEAGPPTDADFEINAIMGRLVDKAEKKRQGLGYDVDWHEGYITIQTFDMDKSWDEPVSTRRMKLGKWLRKQGASAEVIKDFETRQMPTWDWEISAHPYDILTMSFDRPWTSCMRPPTEAGYDSGEAQYGPLTDMAAGSAILFFYRPGAKVPCGRLLLRPAASPDGLMLGILDGGRTYGCGPVLGAEQLSEMLEPYSSITVYRHPFCPYGHKGYALTRNIYSDTDHEFCQQTAEQYDEAYGSLVKAPWPEPKLSMEDAWAVASEFQGQLSTRPPDGEDDDEEFEYPITDMSENFVYDWMEQEWPSMGSMRAYALYTDQGALYAEIFDYVTHRYPDAPPYIIDDVEALVRDELFLDGLSDRMNAEDLWVMAFPERSASGLPIGTLQEMQSWSKLLQIFTASELDRYFAAHPYLAKGITTNLDEEDIRESNLYIVTTDSVLEHLEHLRKAAVAIVPVEIGEVVWTGTDLE